jgi:hypothetical protein
MARMPPANPLDRRRQSHEELQKQASDCLASSRAERPQQFSFWSRSRQEPAKAGTRVPGRGLVYRDERFPTGACDANRSRTTRSSPQGAGAKGWEANARPKEHKWAVRQDVGGEQASTREARKSLTTFCRAQRRERKEQALTRGGPRVERRGEVSRGRSSDGGTHEQKGVSMRRAEERKSRTQ